MPHPWRSRASFRIGAWLNTNPPGALPDADLVTAALGIAPTHAHNAGVVHTPSGTRWKHGQWRLESPLETAVDIEDHIEWLLERLLPVRERVAEILGWDERLKVDFFCGIYLNSYNDQISLTPATLAAIGSLRAELNFDIYGADDSSVEVGGVPGGTRP